MKQVLEICQEVARILELPEPKDLFTDGREWLNIIAYQLQYLTTKHFEDLKSNGSITLSSDESKIRYEFDDYIKDFDSIDLHSTIYIRDEQGRVIKSYKANLLDDAPIAISNGALCVLHREKDWKQIDFIYNSSYIVWDFSNFEGKTSITDNTDVPVFDEKLLKMMLLQQYLSIHMEDMVNKKLEESKWQRSLT